MERRTVPVPKRVVRGKVDAESASLPTKDRGNDIAPTVFLAAMNNASRDAMTSDPATKSRWSGVVVETIATSEIVLNGGTLRRNVPSATPIGAIAMIAGRCDKIGVQIAMSPGSPALADQNGDPKDGDRKDPKAGHEDRRGVADRVPTARAGVDRSALVHIAAQGARVGRVTRTPSLGTIRATRASVGAVERPIVVGAAGDSATRSGSSSPDTGVNGDTGTTVGRDADMDANGRPAVGPAIVITQGGISTARIDDTEIEVSRDTRCEALIVSAIAASLTINLTISLGITDSHRVDLPVTVSRIRDGLVAGSVIITVSAAVDRSLFTARDKAAARVGIGWRGAASAG
jgi:hypothetical protein